MVYQPLNAEQMLRKVLAYLEEYQIQSIVIDNAQHLDSKTLEWLLYIRDQGKPRKSLIFCSQIQAKEEEPHALRLAFSNVPKAKDSVTTKIEIEAIQRTEFRDMIIPALLRNLEIDIAPNIAFITHLWSWTEGNWVRIDRALRLFLKQFENQKPPYMITQDHVLTVKQQLVDADVALDP